jgi:hypothetical protein
MGKACKTDLRRMRWLGRLRVRKFQEESLFSREERRPSQELFLRAFSMRGIPRYLDGRELQVKPKRVVM